MRIVELTCQGCGAKLNVSEDGKKATCEFCDSIFLIDSKTQKQQPKEAEKEDYHLGENTRTVSTKAASASTDVETAPPAKRRRTWLWVLGWILIFPVPLTILMLDSPRTKGIDPKMRVAIAAVGWLVYLAIGLGGEAESNTEPSPDLSSDAPIEQTQTSGDTQDQAAARGGYVNIDSFVEKFNTTSGMTIVDAVEVNDISSKDSGYYRTEYRLGAFDNAVGVVGQIEGYGQIEIVSFGNTGYTDIRIYVDVQDREQAAVMYEALADILVSGDDRKNIAGNVEEIRTSSGGVSSLYLGARYASYYLHDEVYIDVSRVKFDQN